MKTLEYMEDKEFENLKCRLRAYKWGLVSLDDVFGYMQALVDIGYLQPADVTFIVECLTSKERMDTGWIYD